MVYLRYSYAETSRGSHGVSPANDSKQDDHDGDHQQNVNETADGIGADQPQEPQDEQHNSDRIEHGITLFQITGAGSAAREFQAWLILIIPGAEWPALG